MLYCLFAGVVSNHLVHCINFSLGFFEIKDNSGLVLFFFILKLVMVYCTNENNSFLLFWKVAYHGHIAIEAICNAVKFSWL